MYVCVLIYHKNCVINGILYKIKGQLYRSRFDKYLYNFICIFATKCMPEDLTNSEEFIVSFTFKISIILQRIFINFSSFLANIFFKIIMIAYFFEKTKLSKICYNRFENHFNFFIRFDLYLLYMSSVGIPFVSFFIFCCIQSSKV